MLHVAVKHVTVLSKYSQIYKMIIDFETAKADSKPDNTLLEVQTDAEDEYV